ncbi:sugar/nucleoside kinase (ribokinase family) [Motilibacter peucedani]|uniref:Sugar/nucleoside kinase (Ribokinase family) n=1 Tax=Motilibacter peucedani TaxID=598650 RepID=A0A420XUK4_9ACTN|nr:PfkB family carbohydrate kinase [Motilibacter peucedani]RKS80552.1 sugar/nucleoside kinase (ribokinase family) [Motilibacter peucedani]
MDPARPVDAPRRAPARRSPPGLFVGLATLDLVYRVERAPRPDEKVRALSQEVAAGGPAANAAVTYAALGGAATLATALGRHPLALAVLEDLSAHRVVLLDATPDAAGPPPVATAAVEEGTGHRTVVSVGAAASSAEPPDGLTRAAAAASVVVVDGHHPQLALAAARAAQRVATPVVLDAGSWKPVLRDLLPLVTVAACSAGFRPPGVKSAADVPAALHHLGVRTVVVTHGGEPLSWSSGGATGSVEVEPVDAVDTLGAGDAFHGALAWAMATRPDSGLERQLELAATVASQRCRTAGQRAWLRDPALARRRDSWTLLG